MGNTATYAEVMAMWERLHAPFLAAADMQTHDPLEVIRALSDRTDVLVEGGPTLAGAFLRAGVVNRILAYVAPILLGGPVIAVDDVGVPSIGKALRWRYDGIETLGPDLLLSLVPS